MWRQRDDLIRVAINTMEDFRLGKGSSGTAEDELSDSLSNARDFSMSSSSLYQSPIPKKKSKSMKDSKSDKGKQRYEVGFSKILLPPLSENASLQDRRFTINEECTSLKLSPSGRLLIAGFTDGTLRLFDLTGRYKNEQPASVGKPSGNQRYVLSKHHVHFGAVACQIISKGVHTSLLMDVDVSQDGLWAFAGVLRGSMELVAVHLGHLEESYNRKPTSAVSSADMLDQLTVHRHLDAKLRGFGACTRLRNRNEYLLLTGKAIKNIHIWSFKPPTSSGQDPVWTQLYDTQTNGNTIKWLSFRYTKDHLYGLSKSDGQKLRVWDLTSEDSKQEPSRRPSRPPFQDVAHTEAALGVAGDLCLCGGHDMYNTLSLVSLDVDNLQSPYNHTELALPSTSNAPPDLSFMSNHRRSRSRRQQRGDLKNIETVAGMVHDAGQALLELSDGSMVQYTENERLPRLQRFVGGNDEALMEGWSRRVCVDRVASSGTAVAAVALYNPASGKGSIRLTVLEDAALQQTRKFWGFLDRPTLPYPIMSPDHKGTLEKDDTTLDVASARKVTTVKKRDVERGLDTNFASDTLGHKESTAESDKLVVTPRMSDLLVRSKGGADRSLPAARRLSSASTFSSQSSVRCPKKSRLSLDSEASLPLDVGAEVNSPVLERSVTKGEKAGPSKKKRDTDTVRSSSSTPVPRRGSFAEASTESTTSKRRRPSPLVPRRRVQRESTDSLLDVGQALCDLSNTPRSRPQSVDMASVIKSPAKRMPRNDPVLQDQIRAECTKQQAKLRRVLRDDLSVTLVRKRDYSFDEIDEMTLDEFHAMTRNNLATEHRAAQRRVARSLVNAAVCILDSVKYSPTFSSLEQARDLLRSTLQTYKSAVVSFV